MSRSVLMSRPLLPGFAIDFRCAETEQAVSWVLRYDREWGLVEQWRGVLLGLWIRPSDGPARSFSHPQEMADALYEAAFPANGAGETTVLFVFHDLSVPGRDGIKLIRGLHHAVCPLPASVPSKFALA